MGERNQPEKMHVIGRPGTGVVGFGHRIGQEPHGCGLQVVEAFFQRCRERGQARLAVLGDELGAISASRAADMTSARAARLKPRMPIKVRRTSGWTMIGSAGAPGSAGPESARPCRRSRAYATAA